MGVVYMGHEGRMGKVRNAAVAAGLLSLLEASGIAVAQLTAPRPGAQKTAEELTRVRVLADSPRVGPGQRFSVAVVFDIEAGWHTYWRNPGAGALPPTVAVRGPAGFRAGDVLWTRPAAFSTELGEAYGYEGQAVMFVPVTAPPRLDEGRAAFEVEVRWAVCTREKCLLGRAVRSVEVATSATAVAPPPREETDPVLAKHRKRIPRPLAEAGGSASFDGAVLHLSGPAEGAARATVFPSPSAGVTFSAARIEFRQGRFEAQIDVEIDAVNTLGERPMLAGVVALGDRPDDPSYEFSVPGSADQRRSP